MLSSDMTGEERMNVQIQLLSTTVSITYLQPQTSTTFRILRHLLYIRIFDSPILMSDKSGKSISFSGEFQRLPQNPIG